MGFDDSLKAILEELEETLGGVSERQVGALQELLSGPRAVFVTGEGRSGLVARCFAMRLMHLGVPAHVVGGTTTPAFGEGDLLIAVSGSGETDLTCAVARLAKEAGGRVAAVTASDRSPLASAADLALVIPAAYGSGGKGASAQYGRSLFEQAALLVLDAVALRLQRELDQAAEKMDTRHANLE
jgi:6-phospho-3-hexuloisomerase